MSELRNNPNPRCTMSDQPILATPDDVIAAFEALEDVPYETLSFKLVESPPSRWRDLSAFILLDRWCPEEGRGGAHIVECAEHDQIWLAVTPRHLAGKITADDVLTLRRCGVLYDDATESLSMCR